MRFQQKLINFLPGELEHSAVWREGGKRVEFHFFKCSVEGEEGRRGRGNRRRRSKQTRVKGEEDGGGRRRKLGKRGLRQEIEEGGGGGREVR